MIERYRVLAGRIRQELGELEKVLARVERAVTAARQSTEDQDLYVDSAALNLHDFYTGIERIFHHIAATIDDNVPSGQSWHRDLLQQMGLDLPQVRPRVLSTETISDLEEYLRFRHVVRNIYTFEFDMSQIERLTQNLRPSFDRARTELMAFAVFLERLAQDNADA